MACKPIGAAAIPFEPNQNATELILKLITPKINVITRLLEMEYSDSWTYLLLTTERH